MVDRYPSFAELREIERLGQSYRIVCRDLGTPVVILAPHGGKIEPGTSLIASAIAQGDLSLYLFEGLRRRPHGHLHIASSRFDEPIGLELIKGSVIAIAVHGRADDDAPEAVSMGGLDNALGKTIATALRLTGFKVVTAKKGLAGLDPQNICNRGASKAGVQLELPKSLRELLTVDATKLRMFSGAVRQALGLIRRPR